MVNPSYYTSNVHVIVTHFHLFFFYHSLTFLVQSALPHVAGAVDTWPVKQYVCPKAARWGLVQGSVQASQVLPQKMGKAFLWSWLHLTHFHVQIIKVRGTFLPQLGHYYLSSTAQTRKNRPRPKVDKSVWTLHILLIVWCTVQIDLYLKVYYYTSQLCASSIWILCWNNENMLAVRRVDTIQSVLVHW